MAKREWTQPSPREREQMEFERQRSEWVKANPGKCCCTLRERVLGDGCYVCNPQAAKEDDDGEA